VDPNCRQVGAGAFWQIFTSQEVSFDEEPFFRDADTLDNIGAADLHVPNVELKHVAA
jgi:hypothetical protein